MAPNPKGQLGVLEKAYADAGLAPSDISYIEVHGSGTAIGDPIEMNVLSRLFAASNLEKGSVGIGSVKSNIGHLLPAASGAGLAKVLLCLKNKKLVPSLHMKNINPSLRLETSPFYVVKEYQNWISKDNKTRKSGVSSFGLGGTNAHVIVEEYVQAPVFSCKEELCLMNFSAKSTAALERMIEEMQLFIEKNKDVDIHDICFTRNCYRPHYSYRAAAIFDAFSRKMHSILFSNTPVKKNITKVFFTLDDKAFYEKWYQIIDALQSSTKTELNMTALESNLSNEVLISLDTIYNKSSSYGRDYLLQKLYVEGVNFNWEYFYPYGSGRIISLPSYPFEKKNFWLHSLT